MDSERLQAVEAGAAWETALKAEARAFRRLERARKTVTALETALLAAVKLSREAGAVWFPLHPEAGDLGVPAGKVRRPP